MCVVIVLAHAMLVLHVLLVVRREVVRFDPLLEVVPEAFDDSYVLDP